MPHFDSHKPVDFTNSNLLDTRFQITNITSKQHQNCPEKHIGKSIVGIIALLCIGLILQFNIDSQAAYASAQRQAGSDSFAVAGSDGSTVLDAPAGNPVATLEPGTLINTTGRTENNQWVMVRTLGNSVGWVATNSLVIFEVIDLPIRSDSTASDSTASDSTASDSTASDSTASDSTASDSTAMNSNSTDSPTNDAADADQMASDNTAMDDTAMDDTALNISAMSDSASSNLPVAAAPTPARAPMLLPQVQSVSQNRVLSMVRSNGTALRNSPNGSTLTSLQAGATINASGRSADGTWLYGETKDGRRGWVNKARVVAFGQAELPAIDASGATVSATGSTNPAMAMARRPAPANPNNLPLAMVATDGARLNIRSGPGVQNAIVGKAQRGEQFVVLGRNPSNDWIQIEVADLGTAPGWISASYATINGSPALPQSAQAQPSQAQPSQAQVASVQAVRAQAAPIQAAPAEVVAQASAQAPVAASAAGLSGKLVFQQSLGGEIYVYEFASGSLRKLSGGMDPEISADGSKVVFSRFGGNGGIYTVDINGANEQRIYVDTTVRSPKWSPDGSWIVFSRLTGEYQCRNLGFGLCLQNNPFLSQFTLDTKEERGLTRIDPQGDNFRDIAALNTAYTPDWNENGIVYQAVTSIEVTEDKPDGDTNAVLKQTIGYQDPDWQPNGGRIIFQVQQSSHWEIFSAQPDGGGLRALTKPVTTLVDALPSNVSPAWSPDGHHIVYVSNRAAREEAGAWRLWVMQADGSNKRMLPINIELEYAFNKEQMVSWGR